MLNDLFQKSGLEIPDETINISNEMIDPQLNDGVVPSIISIFEDLIEFNDKYDTSTSKLFKMRVVQNEIKKLDKTIYDRFGIKIRVLGSDDDILSTIAIPPNNHNVLNSNLERLYELTENIMKWSKKENAKDIDKVNDDTNMVSIFSNIDDSMKSLDEVMNSSGVIIDRKRAKMSGLPDDYRPVIFINIRKLVKDYELTAEELTGVFLHEVGHIWTHLEYSYKTLHNTNVILNTIDESLNKKNNSFKKTMILTNQELTKENEGKNTDIKTLENDHVIKVTIKTLDKYAKYTKQMSNNMNSSIDSEQLADQFPGRFGLSAPTASGLKKIVNELHGSEFVMVLQSILPAILVYTIAIAVMGGLLAAISFMGFITLITIVSYFIGSIFYSIFTLGKTTDPKTYDFNPRRVKRMRNEVVRLLRNGEVSKSDINTVLTELKMLDKIFSDIHNNNDKTLMDKLMLKLSKQANYNQTRFDLEEITEDLIENELHVKHVELKNKAKEQ